MWGYLDVRETLGHLGDIYSSGQLSLVPEMAVDISLHLLHLQQEGDFGERGGKACWSFPLSVEQATLAVDAIHVDRPSGSSGTHQLTIQGNLKLVLTYWCSKANFPWPCLRRRAREG